MPCLAATVSKPPVSASAGSDFGDPSGDLAIDPEQVLDGVLILESGQSSQRSALFSASVEIGLDQSLVQRRQGAIDRSLFRSASPSGGHLSILQTLEDALPGLEGRAIGQIGAERFEVERCLGTRTVTADAGGVAKRCEVGRERDFVGTALDRGRRGPYPSRATRTTRPATRLTLSIGPSMRFAPFEGRQIGRIRIVRVCHQHYRVELERLSLRLLTAPQL